MKFKFLILLSAMLCLNLSNLHGQSICEIAEPLCSNESFSGNPPAGNPGGTINGGCQMLEADDVTWYFVKIYSGTTFTFVIDPDNNDDYDFAVWKNPNCNNLGIADRASYAAPPSYTTGLSMTATDTCETAAGDGYVKFLNVVPGDEILIAVDKFSDWGAGFTLIFGGDAVLDCTIVGNSYGKCDDDNNNVEQFVAADFLPDLLEEYPNNQFEFYATEAAAESGTGAQISFPLNVNYNGGASTDIYVRIETLAGTFVRIIMLKLYVNKTPTLLTNVVTLPLQCPDENGLATFNLTQAQASLVANPAHIIFHYYTTYEFAEAGGDNFIIPPNAYTTTGGSVFVRVGTGPVDGNPEGCFRIAEIILPVSDFYVPEQIFDEAPLCDEDGNGFVNVDLTTYATQFVTNPADYVITYHLNPVDAGTGNNPINPATNYQIPAGTNVTVYVRIKSLTDPCYSVSRLNFITLARPVLNDLTNVVDCIDQQEGNVEYDLTNFANQIVANPADYTITYHVTQADADTGLNPIGNPALYPIPVNTPITIYIRVDANGCAHSKSVQITLNSIPEVNPDIVIADVCDSDGDGTISVDLTDNEADLVTDPANYVITYYLNQADADNGVNPIANPTNYTINAGETVVFFVRVQNLTNDCFRVRTITYTTVERPELNDLDDVSLCVDQINGNYAYDLTQFNALVVANPTDYTITYHISQADADSGNNPIGTPNAYMIPVNTPITIFVRVETSGCHDTRAVQIAINSNPVVNDLPNQAFCTLEVSGTVPYDLTQHNSEWVDNPGNFTITYHTSQNDADLGQNAIPNPTAYMITVGSNTNIYIRVENPLTGCFKTTVLTLFPGATATLNTGVEVVLCDENFDGTYLYNLTQLNAQLMANPANFTFTYYLTEQNAEDNINPIAQSQWNSYPMTTLPYEIWVVATSVDDCRSVPVKVTFVAGTDIAVLVDTYGPVEYCIEDTVDLIALQPEITTETGVTFSYHLTLSDAQNGINPIANTSEFVPQGNNSVYVRLEKNDRCPVIVEIEMELLPTPSLELNNNYYELCPGSTFEAIATSDDPNATYIWMNGEVQVGNESTLSITQNGTYTIIIIGENGCMNEDTLTVTTPPTPMITGLDLTTNSITVSASSGDGAGILEYSLDGVFWQSTPRFENLVGGQSYTVYVREDGCMIDSYVVGLVAISNFISPNNDGKNDTWEVRGIEITPDATLKIFDRYGKIFVDTTFEGDYIWNGKYLGNNVPSGDYWYIITIPGNEIVKPQRFTGHVSVRNQ